MHKMPYDFWSLQTEIWYNGGMTGAIIAQARLRTGITQVELAKRLGMTKGQLWKIEKGTSEPRAETLDRIAKTLGTTVDAMRASAPTPSSYVAVRSACAHLHEVRRAVERREARLEKLFAARKVSPATTVPLVHGYLRQPHANEILARSLRDALGVGTAAFSNLFWTLEFANVRIHRLAMPEGESSASWWHPVREALTVALNRDETAERQVFRLAYELGAACLYRSSGNRSVRETKQERRFLGAFAADFLMPASALADMVAKAGLRRDDWAFSQLCVFKRHFGVSAEALVIRLDELGLIDRKLRMRLRDELRAYYAAHPKDMEPASPCGRALLGQRWAAME